MEFTSTTHSEVTGPVYRGSEPLHGPCYVLCPYAYGLGIRKVLAVMPAKNPPIPPPRAALAQPLAVGVARRTVVWPKGRAYDFVIVDVSVRAPEPRWAARARELKAAGYSERRILSETSTRSVRRLREILYGNKNKEGNRV